MKIDLWTTILSEQEYEEMLKNLSNYAKYNQFPPKPADLLKEDHEVKYTGPTVAETKTMFNRWDENSKRRGAAGGTGKASKRNCKDIGY